MAADDGEQPPAKLDHMLDLDGIEATIDEVENEEPLTARGSLTSRDNVRASPLESVVEETVQQQLGNPNDDSLEPVKRIYKSRVKTIYHFNTTGGSCRYEVTIDRGNRSTGLAVNRRPLGLLVVQVEDNGPVKEWNDSNKGERIIAGDLIVAINGAHASAEEMLSTIRSETHLVLTLRRLMQYEVVIQKKKCVGLEVSSRKDTILIVKLVGEGGPVEEWNRTAQPQNVVRIGDRITKVNGVMGNTVELLDEIRTSNTVTLCLRRPDITDGIEELAPFERPSSARWGWPLVQDDLSELKSQLGASAETSQESEIAPLTTPRSVMTPRATPRLAMPPVPLSMPTDGPQAPAISSSRRA
eukprot:TRINITY_DN19613_c0_g1_i2.p1 TRINITY_DN19613_c0_g1~~TRINITY_DN19613_c0_g1_i2.p1  ORF type:complete len:370 (+),score=54.69 TRINITY_DN19613_c0_g1_i2:44-1111(+)